MSNIEKLDIQSLSPSERILLAEKLWDSVVEQDDSLEVTEAQKKLLDQRLASLEASPDDGYSWEEVKSEMK